MCVQFCPFDSILWLTKLFNFMGSHLTLFLVLQHESLVSCTGTFPLWIERQVDQQNRTENLEMNLHSYGHLIFVKGAKTIQWIKDSIFNNWCLFNWMVISWAILLLLGIVFAILGFMLFQINLRIAFSISVKEWVGTMDTKLTQTIQELSSTQRIIILRKRFFKTTYFTIVTNNILVWLEQSKGKIWMTRTLSLWTKKSKKTVWIALFCSFYIQI
mgnify:CR=1 FL=1